MDSLVTAFVGLVLLGMGYFIGVKQKIGLVHSYHYKNVAEEDKPDFCKKVGLGNVIIGIAVLCVPVLRPQIGESAALAIAGVAAVGAGVLVISTILKYNHSLF